MLACSRVNPWSRCLAIRNRRRNTSRQAHFPPQHLKGAKGTHRARYVRLEDQSRYALDTSMVRPSLRYVANLRVPGPICSHPLKSPWNSVEHAVEVFNATQALSNLLAEVISSANIEGPASDAPRVGKSGKENWIADAPHDLADSLESIYLSTRKPFEGCSVAPSSLWLVDPSIRITTRTPETVALPSPPKRSFTINAVRPKRSLPSASVVLPAVSSAQVFVPKAATPRISEYAQTIPLIISEPSWIPQSPKRKRSRSSDVDDSDVLPPHKKAKSDMGETVAPEMAPQDSGLPGVRDYELEPIAAGPPESAQETLHDDEAGMDGEETGDGAVPDDDTAPGDNEVQEHHRAQKDAPTPLQRQAYTPRPRRTNEEIAKVTVPNLENKQCGVAGCTKMLCPTDGEKNRPHIKGHHTPAQIASKAPLTCAWAGCGHVEKGIWMTRHVERDHIKYGYFCPFENKCPIKWKGSRAKDQSWHMNVYHPGWRG